MKSPTGVQWVILAACCCCGLHAECTGRTTLSQALAELECFGVGYNLTGLMVNTDNVACSCRYMCVRNPSQMLPSTPHFALRRMLIIGFVAERTIMLVVAC
jgi:hypothetical protein